MKKLLTIFTLTCSLAGALYAAEDVENNPFKRPEIYDLFSFIAHNKNDISRLIGGMKKGLTHNQIILQAIETSIQQGADVNKSNYLGNSPLHCAVQKGYKDCAELLIKNGAKVDAKDLSKNTPLDIAFLQKDADCAEYLFLNGAKLDKKDKNKLLHLFAEKGKDHCLELLVNNNENVNSKDEKRETPLYKAAAKGNLACVKLLIASKAEIDSINGSTGQTPFSAAICGGHKDCAKIFMKHGADIHKPDNNVETPLHVAALHGHVECLKLLIDAKVEIDAKDILGYTPLVSALVSNNIDCIALLLVHGSDINACSQFYFNQEVVNKKLQAAIEDIIKNPLKYVDEKIKALLCLANEYDENSLLHENSLNYDMFYTVMKSMLPLPLNRLQDIINYFANQSYESDDTFMQLLQETQKTLGEISEPVKVAQITPNLENVFLALLLNSLIQRL
ncbi:MAG: ankyrin repeat domain-containing protein [Candidatus Babeliales bacterium]